MMLKNLKMNFIKKITNNIKFDIVVIVLGLFLTFFIWRYSGEDTAFMCYFANYLDPIMGILTFLLAVIIGYRTWTEKLPKKLTVHFKYGSRYVFTCHKTYLAGEGDIRQWGQQIGKQMNGNKNLDFYPYIDQSKPTVNYQKRKDGKEIIKTGNYLKWLFSSKLYKHYIVTFYLAKDIDNYTVWWDNDTTNFDNKSIVVKGNKENIISEQMAQEILDAKENQKNEDEKSIKINNMSINLEQVEIPVKEKGMINLSNHSSDTWSSKQYDRAIELYEYIYDIHFPHIHPKADKEDIKLLAFEYFTHIKKTLHKKNHQNFAVHLMGEQTFCYALVTLLKKENIKVIASTTERNVVDLGDGKKETTFEFVQFREY